MKQNFFFLKKNFLIATVLSYDMINMMMQKVFNTIHSTVLIIAAVADVMKKTFIMHQNSCNETWDRFSIIEEHSCNLILFVNLMFFYWNEVHWMINWLYNERSFPLSLSFFLSFFSNIITSRLKPCMCIYCEMYIAD